MTYVLGIDTGGTYTDGVILERETKTVIASTKARTTHRDLAVGIGNVIDYFSDEELSKIDYVALSTTLATNAVVEGKGCRVGLLLLGSEVYPDLPPCLCKEIGGKIDLSGIEQEPLDLTAVEQAAEEFRGRVDTVAVSGYFSIRNPLHEEQAKQKIQELLQLPVVAAHELTGTLGVQERTNTAVLNARLLGVIDRLLRAVKQVLNERGLDIPLMIVKGDGSLMTESVAKERPIETILSGPAASIIGATYLQAIKNGLVVDIGGTTTDIALLVKGKPSLTEEGAEVGGWRTRVSAVNAYTFGFGGDSYYHRNPETGSWDVGPMRSWPISVIAEQYPHYKTELVGLSKKIGIYRYGYCDGLILLTQPDKNRELSPLQKKLIDALADGPHTMVTLGKRVGSEPDFFRLDELISYGIVGMVGFTPTDVLCAAGELQQGDPEAAALARKRIAHQQGITEAQLDAKCRAAAKDKLQCDLLSCVLKYNGRELDRDNDLADYWFRNAMDETPNDLFEVAFRFKMPVVGIGAPVAAWLPQAVANFQTETLISHHYNVTNAIGAAAGDVMHLLRLNLQNKNDEYLVLFAPWGRVEYHRPEPDEEGNLIPYAEFTEQILNAVIADAETRLRQQMSEQGIDDFEILTERKDKATGGKNNDNVRLFIESKIELAAVGAPVWAKKGGK